MDNTRVEQIVVKKSDSTTMMVRVITVLLTVLGSFLALGLLGYFGLVLIFFIVYLAMYTFKMLDVEYEYLLVNNELSVDAIYGREKRKSLIAFNVSEAEIFAPIESDRVHNYLHNDKLVAKNFTSGNEDAKVYVLVINSDSNHYKVFLEPNDKLFEGIEHYIPRKTYTE